VGGFPHDVPPAGEMNADQMDTDEKMICSPDSRRARGKVRNKRGF